MKRQIIYPNFLSSVKDLIQKFEQETSQQKAQSQGDIKMTYEEICKPIPILRASKTIVPQPLDSVISEKNEELEFSDIKQSFKINLRQSASQEFHFQSKFVESDEEESQPQVQLPVQPERSLMSMISELKTENSRNRQQSTFKIQQVDSDEEVEQKDKQPSLDIEINDELLKQEVDSRNNLLLSVCTRKIQNSLQIKRDEQSHIQSSLQLHQQDILTSKFVLNTHGKLIQVRGDNYFEQKIQFIWRIQRFFKKRIILKRLKSLLKKARYRKHVIQELIATEAAYVNDLKIIITEIITPLRAFVDYQDLKKMFDVESIYNLNMSMLNQLNKYNDKLWRQHELKIIEAMVDYVVYFKLYYDYCKNYDNSIKLLQQYERTHKKFQEFIKNLNKKNTLRGLDIPGFLIKPVQRLPKYVLLLKDLLKHTDESHPDYKNIITCLDCFQKINNQNNTSMQKALSDLKKFDLQTQYGQYVQILEANREFIFEETCQVYFKRQEYAVILYAFNNLLLLTKQDETRNPKQSQLAGTIQEGKQKYWKHVQLNHLSIVNDRADTQFFENLIEVVTKTESIVFIISNELLKEQLLGNLRNIVDNLIMIQKEKEKIRILEKNHVKYNISVKVVHTETQSQGFHKFTVYVIEVRIENVTEKIFVRYSQMSNLEQLIKKKDPQLKVPHFGSRGWLSNQDPKVIDDRKLMIEQFLKLILYSDKIMENEEYRNTILKELKLDPNFFNLPDINKTRARPSVQKQDTMKYLLESQFDRNPKASLTQVKGAKLLQLHESNVSTYIDAQSNDVIVGAEASKCEICVLIELCDGKKLQVGFLKNTKVQQIRDSLGMYLNLQYWPDFKLFMSDAHNNCHLIDDQQQLSALIMNNPMMGQSGRLSSLLTAFSKILRTKEDLRIVFKKYNYQMPSQEEADYQVNSTRLRLLVYQSFQEIYEEKYILNIQEYFLVAALYIIINDLETNPYSEGVQGFSPEIVKKIIPPNIYKACKDRIWVEKIVDSLKSLQPDIDKIRITNTQKQLELKKIFFIDKYSISMLVFMNFMKNNPLFGMHLFFVECPQATQSICQHFQSKLKLLPNVYIGINCYGVHFLNPSTKQIMYSIQLEACMDIKAFALELHLVVEQKTMIFNTPMAFEIKTYIQKQQAMQALQEQLLKPDCGS